MMMISWPCRKCLKGERTHGVPSENRKLPPQICENCAKKNPGEEQLMKYVAGDGWMYAFELSQYQLLAVDIMTL